MTSTTYTAKVGKKSGVSAVKVPKEVKEALRINDGDTVQITIEKVGE